MWLCEPLPPTDGVFRQCFQLSLVPHLQWAWMALRLLGFLPVFSRASTSVCNRTMYVRVGTGCRHLFFFIVLFAHWTTLCTQQTCTRFHNERSSCAFQSGDRFCFRSRRLRFATIENESGGICFDGKLSAGGEQSVDGTKLVVAFRWVVSCSIWCRPDVARSPPQWERPLPCSRSCRPSCFHGPMDVVPCQLLLVRNS